MEHFNGLPIYWLDIENENNGIEIISLVDDPAIETNFVKFSECDDTVKFSVQDEEKHIVSGPALIPDKPILRKDKNGLGFYVKFSKESIERIAIDFFEKHNSTNVNLMHETMVDGCVYFESYIINSERGIKPAEYSDLPDGSWIVSCKINNPDVWELIKNGTIKGFSVEGNLHFNKEEKKEFETLQELLEYLFS